MKPRNPLCFALDFPTLGHALYFIERHQLQDRLGAVKVGLELFMSAGPYAVYEFGGVLDPGRALPVVLDLKLHDIPETVARAVKVGGDLGVKYMTLHVQQRRTLEEAVKAAEPYGITLLGVTVLTSMTERDFDDLHYGEHDTYSRVINLVRFGLSAGLRGFVCSPQEVKTIRLNCTAVERPFLLVPGIRPAGADAGDQKRTGTPAKAIKDGADLLVVGRPIRDAADPAAAADAILAEIGGEEDAPRTT